MRFFKYNTLLAEKSIDIKAKQDTLMNSANALFAKVYEQAQGAAGAGPQPGADAGSQSGPADDVVDGDYKEV